MGRDKSTCTEWRCEGSLSLSDPELNSEIICSQSELSLKLETFDQVWSHLLGRLHRNAVDPSAEVSLAAAVTFHVIR